MNHTRMLRFEVMEPRIALSANASAILADLQANIAANGIDPQRAQEMLDQIVQSRDDSSASRPMNPPPDGWGDAPIVRFRVEIRDSQDQPVQAVQAGNEYLAKVFVQDMRDLTNTTVAESGSGGIFQAWVDLEFSANLHPTGSVRVNEAFGNRKLELETEGSFLRNLGGASRAPIPFGDAEQFLLEAPFVVDSTDTPSQIQVIPSSSQRDPVVLFDFGNAVPYQGIASTAVDLPRATNIDSSGSTRDPLTDPSDDLSSQFLPPVPPSMVLPNSDDDLHQTASGGDAVALVSYLSFFRHDDPNALWKWRDEEDWWRSERGEDERKHVDDWNELDWPDTESKLLDTKSVNRADAAATEEAKSDEEKAELTGGNPESSHAGLFYDEALFLEGALVETFQSKFRLHLRVFSPQRQANEPAAKSIANNRVTTPRDGFIDIAEILTPRQFTQPWHDNVDEAIADNHHIPSQTHRKPTIDWGVISPLTEEVETYQQSQQLEANQKITVQRTPLAMKQTVSSSLNDAPAPTVQ